MVGEKDVIDVAGGLALLVCGSGLWQMVWNA